MSTFPDPIYELTGITNNFCFFDGIGLVEFDNTINDSGYTYSGLTLVVDFTGFTSHFDTTGHTYSNVILSNNVYTYTGFTNENHYFEINDIYSEYTPYIDPLFGSLIESEIIDGFTTDIISCTEKLDGLTGTCCPTQQILSNLPVVMITNEGGGSDNCDDFIARRTPEGWTLDFVFNKNGDTDWTESVFWFTGVRDEYEIENYADNGLSFRFTSDGKIVWTAYRFSGYCDTTSGYTEMFYIQSGETTNALCSGGTYSDFSIIITFERFNVYEDECDLANQGGWNDLIWTGTTEALTKKWTDERNKRLGVLKIYHNGKPIYKLKGFEETVLSDRGYQPFTHVIGGGVTGSSGIHEGTFCYSIKRAAYYEEPMTFLEVQDHYSTDISSDFTINDCSSPCADVIVMVTPSPTPTVTKTPSVTPTITRTPSITPTITRTPSITPTITRTPSVTPTPVAINSIYGLLYNGDAMSDSRGVVASGWHVPTDSDFDTLINNLGGTLVAGGEAKETGYTYWNSPNAGATNSSGFSGRGAGRRLTSGTFERILENEYFWTSTLWGGDIYNIVFLSHTNATFGSSTSETERGLSIRPVKDSTTLTHGQMGTYVGNDGRIYRTIAIGTGTTQEWLVGNLAETQYQNGDIVTEVRESWIWSGLTTGACCAYDNNWSYASRVAPTPSISSTPSITPTITPTPSNPYWSTRYPDNLSGTTLTGLTGTTGVTVYMTWTNNGVQDYENIIIERSADSGSTYSEIDSIAAGESEYTDETIVDIQTYYYRIRYKLGITYSIYSNICILTESELWVSYWKLQSETLFYGLYSQISNNQMPNLIDDGLTYLTVTGITGSETYECPNNATYKSADTDYIWFRTNESQRTVTTAELVGYDLQRTPVKYMDNSPYNIEEIMILSSAVTGNTRDNLFKCMNLPILWDNNLNLYGHIKGNRFGQQLWVPESFNEPEVDVYMSGLTTPLSSTQITLLNVLVYALKSNLGITYLNEFFDVFYVLAGETSESSLRNLVKNAHHGTLGGTPNPSFFQYLGFQNEGTNNGYINTNYTPSTQGVNATLNSASLGMYNKIKSTRLTTTSFLTGGSSAGKSILISYQASAIFFSINSGANNNNSLDHDFVGVSRLNATDVNPFDTDSYLTIAQASTTISNTAQYIFRAQYYSGYSNPQTSFFWYGKGVTEAQKNIILGAMEAYMDARGNGILT